MFPWDNEVGYYSALLTEDKLEDIDVAVASNQVTGLDPNVATNSIEVTGKIIKLLARAKSPLPMVCPLLN